MGPEAAQAGRGLLGGLVRPPREPSALGILLYSGLLGILTAGQRSPLGTGLAFAALALHILTFDAGFDAARRRDAGLLATVFAVNAAPYAAALLLTRDTGLLLALLVYAPIMAAYAALATRGLLKTAAGYIAGAALLSYVAVPLAALAGSVTPATLTATFIMAAYTASTAAYIESRLPFRRTSPLLGLALWLPALPVAAAESPLLLAAALEPTAKHLANTVRNTKIKPSEIRRLGVKELIRLTVFAAVLAAAFYLAG